MFWFLSTTACVHALWKQDQYFLWPPLSLVVLSHGEFMLGFFFLIFVYILTVLSYEMSWHLALAQSCSDDLFPPCLQSLVLL